MTTFELIDNFLKSCLKHFKKLSKCIPSVYNYEINLGKQAGHTSRAIRFANKRTKKGDSVLFITPNSLVSRDLDDMPFTVVSFEEINLKVKGKTFDLVLVDSASLYGSKAKSKLNRIFSEQKKPVPIIWVG